MRALIISDIHCLSRDITKIPGGAGYHGIAGSSFFIEDRSRHLNRILAIESCLNDQVGAIDVMLCLGDFAHQSKQLAFLQSWNDIATVARSLKIPSIVGITGNHDIASRIEDMSDAEQRVDFLRSVPNFPTANEAANLEYFASGHCELEFDDALLIAVDTCRVHGLGLDAATTQRVWSRGHITYKMIDEIRARIERTSKDHILLIMHHHPERVDATIDTDSDQMDQGMNLLQSLGEIPKAIFLLHGHKHMVRLKRATVGTNPPIILSAASLAAHAYPGSPAYYSNQFHILEVDHNETSRAHGRVLSWDWGSSKWEPSRKPDMPYSQRFGPEISLPDLARQLGTMSVVSQVNIDGIRTNVEKIDFFQVSQLHELNRLLEPYGRELICRQSEVFALVKR